MAKIKWKTKADIEAKKAKHEALAEKEKRFKNKKFTTLSTKEKDALLEQIAKDLGYL